MPYECNRKNRLIIFFPYGDHTTSIYICMPFIFVMITVENSSLSKTCRSTLNYILNDRSDQELSTGDKISREKSG